MWEKNREEGRGKERKKKGERKSNGRLAIIREERIGLERAPGLPLLLYHRTTAPNSDVLLFIPAPVTVELLLLRNAMIRLSLGLRFACLPCLPVCLLACCL